MNRTGRFFLLTLLVATLLPFAVVALPRLPSVLAILTPVSLVSGTHVTATAYLYLAGDTFKGVPHWQLTVVAAPLLLMAAVFLAFLTFPLPALTVFMLIYIHFGLWHFGRQNLGVMTFATRISNKRPMDDFERRTIMAGVIAGMCAAYTAFAPGLTLNTTFFPIDVTPFAPTFTRLWYVGAAIYAVLIPLVLVRIWQKRQNYDATSLALYLASVLFFLPLFITVDPLIAVASWAMAHGLQYLVFLAFHAGNRLRANLFGVLPTVLLTIAAGAGYLIWTQSADIQIQGWGGPMVARIAIATVAALTLAHYWVDMFLWRFRTPERRKWLAENYPFLVGAPSAAPTPAAVPATAVRDAVAAR